MDFTTINPEMEVKIIIERKKMRKKKEKKKGKDKGTGENIIRG